MAQNKILPWAQTGTANVLSDADYASDVASGGSYSDGVKSGQASSQQANKTWRQATAPGAGLAQFIVDNLSVDVTDADTPDTFSTRIANAVLKLAQISPFNQAWATATGGYRKYAIVSDSSGNFWVSTADQNTTTPGADGAKWQSLFNGYATQAWTENQFVKSTVGGGDKGNIQQLTYNAVVGQLTAQTRDGIWHFAQPAGDYATNSALNTETTNRTNADTNLQNQINNRVLKTGDTMTGPLTLAGAYGVATGYSWSETLTLANKYSESTAQILCTTQYGVDTAVRLKSTWGNNNTTVLDLHQDGTITTTYGAVAFESDISNLQNQINGKQAAGDYVTASVYSDDFATSDSRVINLPYGHRLQGFVVAVSGSGVHNIYFPTAFSSSPQTIVSSYGLTNGNNASVSVLGGWTATGFQIQTNGDTSVNFLAMGPR